MSIFKKIFLSLFVYGLFLLGITSVFLYKSAEKTIENELYEHFSSIASLQSNRIDAILSKNIERLKLVSSRTQLRISLQAFLTGNSSRQLERIERILDDALKSISSFSKISLVTHRGELIVSTDKQLLAVPAFYPADFLDNSFISNPENLVLNAENHLLLLLGGPLILDDKVIGALIIESEPADLVASVSNLDGLKKTGETLLVKRLANGERIFLLPSRFDADAALRRVIPPAIKVSQSGQNMASSKLHFGKDYRDQPVFAVTKGISIPGWEVIVKIDKQEALADISEIQSITLKITFAFILLTVLIALLLSKYLTRPIVLLTTVTSRISEGHYQLRAEEGSEDELGILGKSFNLMADNLLSKQAELQDKVGQLETEIGERIKAEKEVENLRGILPLCSICKQIRDEENVWHNVDSYIQEHSQANISHSICPDCMEKHYPDSYRRILMKKNLSQSSKSN